jgi:hypothetical protein
MCKKRNRSDFAHSASPTKTLCKIAMVFLHSNSIGDFTHVEPPRKTLFKIANGVFA